jgi:hypothetical protein
MIFLKHIFSYVKKKLLPYIVNVLHLECLWFVLDWPFFRCCFLLHSCPLSW